MKRYYSFVGALPLFILLTACSGPEIESVEIGGRDIAAGPLTIRNGEVFIAEVVIRNTDDKTVGPATLTAIDKTIAEVTTVSDGRGFAFYGKAPGQTTISIHARGEFVANAQIVVSETQ